MAAILGLRIKKASHALHMLLTMAACMCMNGGPQVAFSSYMPQISSFTTAVSVSTHNAAHLRSHYMMQQLTLQEACMAYLAHRILGTDAEVITSRHQDGPAAVLGINDLHVHKAWAQPEELQVVADHSGQVLVISTIAIPVQVGAVLSSHPIRQRVSSQLIGHPSAVACTAVSMLGLSQARFVKGTIF